ncbi:hypothetical protein JCM3770_001473 [Rhodotorula araucariae]
MAAPIDPGPAIQWAKRPDYTARLVAALVALPARDDQHRAFSAAVAKSQDWKQRKRATLAQLTRTVFTANGDPAREKKQLDSVQRRLAALGKEYSNHIFSLKADPYSEATTLAWIRQRNPHFDDLHAVLADHPEFEPWEEDQNVLPADDDPMQDVHFPVAGPANPALPAPAPAPAVAPVAAASGAPAPQPAPPSPPPAAHQPVAGPAYPNPFLAQLYAQLQEHHQHAAPAPAPAPAPTTADASPRNAAAQAALKRVRDPRSPSPPRAPPPPPAPATPAPAPAPMDAHVDAAAAPLPDRGGGLSHCPKCDIALSGLGGADAEEEHLRQCLDAGGATVHECPVCSARMDGWDEGTAARHVDECCEGATRGGARGAREHVVFVCDDKSVPKDDTTNEPLECIMCFDEFAPASRLARLSCYCVFHEGCIVEFWRAPGKFCPTHRELDSTQEVDMRT